jgi:adenosylmethionine---8-amino-7-oxononanoate aminotransferase
MRDFIVLGTDTDAGKTTFSLHWLAAFPEFAYWKPFETGDSDTATVRRYVPTARAHDPLAARREGRAMPTTADAARGVPTQAGPLLIETFGGPMSPFNDAELQIDFIKALNRPTVLVASSTVGAVGRTLATLRVLHLDAIDVRAIVLVGEPDAYAVEELRKHSELPVFSLERPSPWSAASIAGSAARQRAELQAIHAALSASVESVADADPADRLVERDSRAVWHPYTSLRDPAEPLAVVGAKDEYLELADGRRLIDGVSSWWTILYGHRDPRLMLALLNASERIDHVLFAGVTHPWAVGYAEGLLATTPHPDGRVFYSDNGSTAVEVALKMAYQYWCHRGEPQRTHFIGFEHSYHGDTFGAMAVGRDRLFFNRFEPLLFSAKQIPVNPEALDSILRSQADTTAAVILEPLVQGAGGMRMHSPDTLRQIVEVCQRHGVLFIADEVMTCGRTGTFWAHTQANVVPDLICAAKTLAGGILPLAVTIASGKIVDSFDTTDRTKTFFHGHSFTAHPLACALAEETLRMMTDGLWKSESDRISAFWEANRESLRQPGVADVRSRGTILAVELQAAGGYLADVARTLRETAVANGVLLRPLGNVLYSIPPLCASNESLGTILEAMRMAIFKAGEVTK